MSVDGDRIHGEIACLNTEELFATLISTVGFNCHVWQCAGTLIERGERREYNFVIKKHKFACDHHKRRIYLRDYRCLRDALDEIVPAAMFVATRIDGEANMVVLADAHTPWFDLAQPGNEDEARPLLAHLPKARAQLRRFVTAARTWLDEGRVIDLYGRENLILDRDRNVRYLDSFGVFFYQDIGHSVAGIDDDYMHRIDLSLRRLNYVESLID